MPTDDSSSTGNKCKPRSLRRKAAGVSGQTKSNKSVLDRSSIRNAPAKSIVKIGRISTRPVRKPVFSLNIGRVFSWLLLLKSVDEAKPISPAD